MKIAAYTIDVPQRTDTIKIRVLSDVHLGMAACNEVALQRAIDEIKRTDMYWIGLGDILDAVGKGDRKRFSAGAMASWIRPEDVDDIVGRQCDKALEYLEPIAPKCLAFLSGNHEDAIRKYQERKAYEQLVRSLIRAGAPEQIGLGYAGYLQIVARAENDGRVTNMFLHHGAGGGALLGGKALRLERLMMMHTDAHIVLMGHVHSALIANVAQYRITQRGQVVSYTRYGAICQTFLAPTVEGHGPTYGEVAQYPPSPTGWLDVTLTPRTMRMSERIKLELVQA